jgi:hypothetical protein
MGYLVNSTPFINITGIISISEVNNLGTTPYVFNTPANFTPIGFSITAASGSLQPAFSSKLLISTVSSARTLYLGTDPAVTDLYNFYGYITNVLFSPQFGEAVNIETTIANNFQLQPQDAADPTPGDYAYKFNFFGLIP